MIEVKKFVFTVSLCAMLAVNPVLATAADEYDYSEEWVQTSHPEAVIDVTKLPKVGIASVSYVNRVVETAGNAAAHAEEHAAEAGKYAISAKDSADDAQAAADEAKGALSDKVDVDQKSENKNKAMVTDEKGTVYPGYITTNMIDPIAVTTEKIAEGAVTTERIANGAVTPAKIYKGETGWVTPDMISRGETGWVTPAMISKGETGWVVSQVIANGAVTIDKIDATGSGAGVLVTDGYSGYWGKVLPDMIKGSEDNMTGVMVTDGSRSFWGKLTSDTIDGGAVTTEKIAARYIDGGGNYHDASKGHVLVSTDGKGTAGWGQISGAGIANGAVTTEKIADGTIKNADIAAGAAIAMSKINGLSTALDGKQAKSTADYQMGNSAGGWTAMTDAQKSALNSTITAAKVSTYDGYANSKQDTITDLGAIRSGAELGKTAVQPSSLGALASMGQVGTDQIANNAVTTDKIQGSSSDRGVLWTNGSGIVAWGKVDVGMIANAAVTTDKISGRAVTIDKIEGSSSVTGVLWTNGSGGVAWGKVTPNMIEPGHTSVSGVMVTNGNDVVEWGKVTPGMIKGSTSDRGVLMTDGSGDALWSQLVPAMIGRGNYSGLSGVMVMDGAFGSWGKVTPKLIDGDYSGMSGVIVTDGTDIVKWGKVGADMIAPGAVGISETNGVVGAVPIGKDSTSTYGKFWID